MQVKASIASKVVADKTDRNNNNNNNDDEEEEEEEEDNSQLQGTMCSKKDAEK